MMGEERRLVMEGFTFELTGFFSAEGVTTVTISVNGSGESPSDLKGWAMEACPSDLHFFEDEVGILSCEKRRRHGAWLPAAAQKTSYELTGDIGFAGVVINDWVGRYAEDPDVEYRIVFDKELKFEPFAVAALMGERIHRSDERINIGLSSSPALDRVWMTPLEKSFCLFVVVPEGYRPEGACKVAASATKRAAHILHHRGEFVVDDALAYEGKALKAVRAELLCSVRILADVPLKSATACGDNVQVSAVDCFEVCETIGYADEGTSFELRDITVCPKKKSFDLTLLNAYGGRSVYRLDGKFVIDCKRCSKIENKSVES
jgi:hypothetical protein